MNIWARRTYFIFSIIIFAIVATLLLFYANGWRYNISAHSYKKVGALTINSQPNNANVTLNGNMFKNKTPFTINNLMADQYRLSLWKEGYYDWQQIISINESKTTIIPDVNLIKNQNLDSLYLAINIANYKISNNKKFISIQSDGYLIIHDLEKNIELLRVKSDIEIKGMIWNYNDTSLLIQNDKDYYLFNLAEKKFVQLNIKYNIVAKKYFWDNVDPNVIYASEKENTFRINKFQETIELIKSGHNIIHNFGDYFFIIDELNVLSIIDDKDNKLDFINLSNNHSLIFLSTLNDFLPIIDTSNSKGYFFDLQKEEFVDIEQSLNFINYINPNNLLYINSHEIWQIDNNINSKNLLIRTSENINTAYWLFDNQYLIYTTDNNQIKIAEINRPQNNNYEIDHAMINNLEKGFKDNIFFLINKQGIYKLEF